MEQYIKFWEQAVKETDMNTELNDIDKKLHISDVISSKTDIVDFLKETFYQGWLKSHQDFNAEIEYGNLENSKERLDKMFHEWFDKFYYI